MNTTRTAATATLILTLSACTPTLHTAGPDPRLPEIKRLAWTDPATFAALAPDLTRGAWADLDWHTNGCSVPLNLNTPFKTLFTPACTVHDFAYHNLSRLEPTSINRQRSDNAFLGNMLSSCAHQPITQQRPCHATARTYYAAVRTWGAAFFPTR
ncbi:phospholipase A2 [Deinococcus soli (ex Cha et al. 2016)]|uniref:Phospholipase A2 n=2 Tax=Deinococcus soli (ex Cha et al. 2016) TaxID=1309411 RepID=A0AAE3XCA9_9DEIO|nr:phospholipase A2 [Deinococcus soli (ex Cha et al. 2016)]MDR6218401.1 hypothetical protein [Deinococcus soli (ex Cha et al. 2016)]MDR6329141.1 hypothetical protein [Deinococcus soli (ex Cha et al. 2016)]MDR6751414.1 hypothetical protein [Deinococcus soli (ex Cha et al. 2016)]